MADNTESSSNNRLTTLVLVCFFLSGVTGLIYQILWTRMAVKLIGGAPFAVSIILTIFMAGLGLGSYIAGRILDRESEPARLVKIYGLLELGIAGFALLIPVLLALSTPIYSVVYNQLFGHFWLYSLITFVGCALIFSMPVVCMGATLPVLSRFYVTRLAHLGTHTGRLYGLNTIGAATGALLCGFWLINILGVWATLILAVAINALIGVACLFAARKTVSQDLPDKLETIPPFSPPREACVPSVLDRSNDPWLAKGVLLIFAVSGFSSMACEVIWTKLLGLMVGPTTYSFTMVLVTFILGLALGSMLFGWLADKTGKPLKLLLITQVAAAVSILLVSQLLGDSQLFFAKLIFAFKDHFGLLNLAKSGALFVFMIFPTLCLGAAFPLVGKLYTQSISKVGSCIGTAYAINTIGAVLGSFCAGFLLIPLIGKEHGLSLVVALQLITILFVGGGLLWRKHKSIFRLSVLTTPVLAGLFLTLYLPTWNHTLLSIGKYHRIDSTKVKIDEIDWLEALIHGTDILARTLAVELVYYGDGIGGFTTVTKSPDVMGNYSYALSNSGKPDASSRGDMNTQTLLAHFPMLFHNNPKSVMVLGLASGVTAGEVLLYPVEQIDIVDINEQVVKASEFFAPWNGGVLSNPRTNLIIQDARAHLNLTERSYDVIISEPSNPWMAGLATLFTEDFFEIVKDRLNEGGIFAQFMHSYQMNWTSFALVGRTFSEVFPNSLILVTNITGHGNDFLLIGLNGKDKLELDQAKRNMAYARQSVNVALADPRILYAMLVSEDLAKTFGEGPINTDNHPLLEYAAPRMMYREDPAIADNLRSNSWLREASKDIAWQAGLDIDTQIDKATYALSLYRPFENMLDLSKADASQKARFFRLVEAYCQDNPTDSSLFDDELRSICRRAQLNSLEEIIDRVANKAASYAYLGKLYEAEGNAELAMNNYSKSLLSDPGDAWVHASLGSIAGAQGRPYEAMPHFIEALRIDPNYAKAHNNLGDVLIDLDRTDQAINHFSEALRLAPNYRQAQINLAAVLARTGRLEESSGEYQKALEMAPEDPDIYYAWSDVLTRLGQTDRANRLTAKARQLQPGDQSGY